MATCHDEVYNLSDDEQESNSDTSDATEVMSSENDDDDLELNPTWSNMTAGLRRIPFIMENKLFVPIPGEGNPIDWFSLLLDNIFLEFICRETNKYALELFCGPSTSELSRITRWKDITVPELKVFLGLLLHTGTIRLNRIQDYWKTNRMFNLPVFRQYMSRDRFLLIMRCLHFSKVIPSTDPQPSDRLHKVREIMNYFNNKMMVVYYPSRELSIDEAMVLWRGRLVFRQYIKGKRHKYGIKLYSVNEPDGLIMKFMVYAGATDELAGKGHASKVVLKLMEGKLGCGHSLFLDNFYNSFSLATKLLARRTYCTGTLRADRKHNPALVKSATLKKGETIAQYAEGVMVGKWKDKRVVLYISNEFENEMATIANKRGVPREKPLPIVQYNAHMKGVDRADQMLSYYPCERKTLRWYKKIFVHFLQMIMINSLHLYSRYQDVNKPKMALYDFRLSVIEALLPPQIPQSVSTPPGRRIMHRLVKNEELDSKGSRKRKRCRVCGKNGIKKLTTYMCEVCPDKPGMCEIDCFDKFHENL